MRSRSPGLTLIELLVASVLLGTVLVVLMQGVSFAVRASSDAHREAIALPLVESLVARIRTGEITVGTNAEGTFEEEGEPAIRWTVEFEPAESLQRADIAVFWPATVGEDSITVSMLVREPTAEEAR